MQIKTALFLLLIPFAVIGCSTPQEDPSAQQPAVPEPLARTEFTNRIENFFEYEPLQTGKPSQFLIHLTDLTDGAPVEQATVTLTVRSAEAARNVAEVTARVGKVSGIYVAEVNIPQRGDYDIEFHVKNAKLDERLPLSGFKVE